LNVLSVVESSFRHFSGFECVQQRFIVDHDRG
jgi:hypothetical protein